MEKNRAEIKHVEEDPHDLSGYFDREWSSKLSRVVVPLSKIIDDATMS